MSKLTEKTDWEYQTKATKTRYVPDDFVFGIKRERVTRGVDPVEFDRFHAVMIKNKPDVIYCPAFSTKKPLWYLKYAPRNEGVYVWDNPRMVNAKKRTWEELYNLFRYQGLETYQFDSPKKVKIFITYEGTELFPGDSYYVLQTNHGLFQISGPHIMYGKPPQSDGEIIFTKFATASDYALAHKKSK